MSSSLLPSSTQFFTLLTTTSLRTAVRPSPIAYNALTTAAKCRAQWRQPQIIQKRTIISPIRARAFKTINEENERKPEWLVENLKDLVENHGWKMRYDDGGALMKTFKLKRGMEAHFFDRMLTTTQEYDHHPTLIWAGDLVSVEWTTHTPPGVGPKDVKLARKTDEIVRGIHQIGYKDRKEKLEKRFWPTFEGIESVL